MKRYLIIALGLVTAIAVVTALYWVKSKSSFLPSNRPMSSEKSKNLGQISMGEMVLEAAVPNGQENLSFRLEDGVYSVPFELSPIQVEWLNIDKQPSDEKCNTYKFKDMSQSLCFSVDPENWGDQKSNGDQYYGVFEMEGRFYGFKIVSAVYPEYSFNFLKELVRQTS